MNLSPRAFSATGLMVVTLLTAGGCSNAQDRYCGAVEDHRGELARIVDSGDRDALLRALPILQDLQSRAPSDIIDDYQLVTTRLRTLQGALQDAGVDPATYDRARPPADVTPAHRRAIDAAAKDLGDGTTLQALGSIDQEVRDVCHTPLGV